MYYKPTSSIDENKLTIPVVEVFEIASHKTSLFNNFPATGLQVSIWPQDNPWKRANDKAAYQVTWNVILSGMQIAIIVVSIIRLNQWALSDTGLLAIGPACIILEAISAVLRSACTFVDPFLSFRVIPMPAADIIITVHLPFQLSCGILLTFYWAETLTKNKIKAVPFVSEYKKTAFFVIALLFGGEIATSAARALTAITVVNSVYFTLALYVLVAGALTVSYVICAVQIRNRLSESKAPRRSIRNLTIRLVLSTTGYVMFIILTILLIPYLATPWGWKICLNLIFFSTNITGILQVYSFVPPRAYSSHNSNSKRVLATVSSSVL